MIISLLFHQFFFKLNILTCEAVAKILNSANDELSIVFMFDTIFYM